ncbi:hypothetical protein FKP32DRAFT_1581272 [Trametes sanguinea]|nr:hypothetical protein FKP32DRAFT_1581272 [Trametes sanguinea]
MEEVRGLGRGSYIWGRSVHNIRIERLWVDVTAGFGHKWKEFFRALEAFHDLNVDNDAHVWLLHHLFLDTINRDAHQWAETWNHHVIARRGERHLSPAQMYIRGLAEHGQRGIRLADLNPDLEQGLSNSIDYADYGIDWEDIGNEHIRQHHDIHNPNDGDHANPFLTDHPAHLSHVEVPTYHCPLTSQQLFDLDLWLTSLPCYSRQNMEQCLTLWDAALDAVKTMY